MKLSEFCKAPENNLITFGKQRCNNKCDFPSFSNLPTKI